MTYKEALRAFKRDILPDVDKAHGKNDKVARREAWSGYTDGLCRVGSITLKQYETWNNPF